MPIPLFWHILSTYPSLSLCSDIYLYSTHPYPCVLSYTDTLPIPVPVFWHTGILPIPVPVFWHIMTSYPSLSLCSAIYVYPTHPYPCILTYTDTLHIPMHVFWHNDILPIPIHVFWHDILPIPVHVFWHILAPYQSLSLCSDIYWHSTHPYP